LPPDKTELLKIREAVKRLNTCNIVITSVTRDDLDDGGAGHFADCIRILRDFKPGLKIEVLVPDFLGKSDSIEDVIYAGPDVFSHNLETVPWLYSKVRPQADYGRSLDVLRLTKQLRPGIITKSGIMVGLGETRAEIYAVMKDLIEARCDVLTIGQYLKPASWCIDVVEFLEPNEFMRFSKWAEELGFKRFRCSPFTRSSYFE
jgi:lipoic acid synthetase